MIYCRNVLTSQEVVDFVSQRLEKQSDSDTVSLSKICEEVIVLFKGVLKSSVKHDVGQETKVRSVFSKFGQ